MLHKCNLIIIYNDKKSLYFLKKIFLNYLRFDNLIQLKFKKYWLYRNG